MESLIVTGGNVINGCIDICGAKNSVLPILAACFLSDKTIELTNCPTIRDTGTMLNILAELGCRAVKNEDYIKVNTADADSYIIPEAASRQLRSSVFLIGPLLARYKQAVAVYPGGCDIGARPIDLHLKGLRQLNVVIVEKDGKIYCDGSNMKAADIQLDFQSVGATENLMMVAAGIEGVTRIFNAAREPEIVDLQGFMGELGIDISGAGTSVIEIHGSKKLNTTGAKYRIMPDRIVAGTLLCAAAITGGSVTLNSINPMDLRASVSKLEEMGCRVKSGDSYISLSAPERLKSLDRLETQTYPGFPTDMQALFLALCSCADGVSIITENLYENRFRHVPELVKMGASIHVNGRTAVVTGKELYGAEVYATDLRAGAALVLAGLCAKGVTTVNDVDKYIDRGYDHIEKMLCSLGGKVVRINSKYVVSVNSGGSAVIR